MSATAETFWTIEWYRDRVKMLDRNMTNLKKRNEMLLNRVSELNKEKNGWRRSALAETAARTDFEIKYDQTLAENRKLRGHRTCPWGCIFNGQHLHGDCRAPEAANCEMNEPRRELDRNLTDWEKGDKRDVDNCPPPRGEGL